MGWWDTHTFTRTQSPTRIRPHPHSTNRPALTPPVPYPHLEPDPPPVPYPHLEPTENEYFIPPLDVCIAVSSYIGDKVTYGLKLRAHTSSHRRLGGGWGGEGWVRGGRWRLVGGWSVVIGGWRWLIGWRCLIYWLVGWLLGYLWCVSCV